MVILFFFFFSSRRRHTRCYRDWSSDVCSSDLDPALVTGSLMVCGMADVFQLFLQNGRIEVGFLGGAQVDRYGNINTTVIGPYERPAVRLPGSGGAAEIAVHARRTLIVAQLNPRAFPERVDFVTSPGQRCGGRT